MPFICGTASPAASCTILVQDGAGWASLTAAASGATVALTGLTLTYPGGGYLAGWEQPPAWTPEDTDAMLAEHRAAAERAELARMVADARATQLLLSLLTAAQRQSYTRRGWFEVRGSAGGRWRITSRGQAGNVIEVGAGGEPVAAWCCHPPGGLPDADAHLAQMLHLQTDEPGFRRAGNRTPHAAGR